MAGKKKTWLYEEGLKADGVIASDKDEFFMPPITAKITAKKTTDYKVLESYIAEELEKMIKEHIEKGWVLQGGLTIAQSKVGDVRCTLYAQAMVFRT